MAFVAPLLFMILFGIIDLSYYVFSYATVAQAARNGAEAAAQLPPYESWLLLEGTTIGDDGWSGLAADDCYSTILSQVKSDAPLIPGIRNSVTISYPSDTTPNVADEETRNLTTRGPIEVSIEVTLAPLTPIFQTLNRTATGSENWVLRASARRSIENLGLNPDSPNGVSCAKDMDDWRLKHPDAN
jgi:Flp pilus assembly protein TadG